MQKSIFIALVFLLFLPSFLKSQSPWTRSKGGFFGQGGYHFIPTYDQVFGENGENFQVDRQLSEFTFQIYGEYGLGKKTTLIASLPLRTVRSGKQLDPFSKVGEGKLTAISNTQIGLKQKFYEKNGLSFSGILRFELPTKKYDDATGLRIGYDATTILPMASAGMGYRKVYWFGYAGYGFRGNGYSNFVNLGGEVGFHVKKTWLIGFSEILKSSKNGNIQLPARNLCTYFYVNDQSFWSFGGKVIFEYSQFWGAVASFAGVFSAENLPVSPGLGFGVYFKWD